MVADASALESLVLVPAEPLFADTACPLCVVVVSLSALSALVDSILAAIEAASLDVRAGDAGIAVLRGGACVEESDCGCDFDLGAATLDDAVETNGTAAGTGVADADAATEAEAEVGVDAEDGTGTGADG